jgi:hypothetical protein
MAMRVMAADAPASADSTGEVGGACAPTGDAGGDVAGDVGGGGDAVSAATPSPTRPKRRSRLW